MIELHDVTVRYSEEVIGLSNVSLKIASGEFVFVVGPTGAGKSTLLKLLYREEKATEGRVVVNGEDLGQMRLRAIPYYRRKLGVVFQDFGLLADKTVYENVAYALRVIGAGRKEIRQQVGRALDMVGMSHRPDAFPAHISGGEKQRVAIARGLVNDPPLLIADEPTGNLDPETSQGIMQLLNHINENGTTVLVATHDHAVVDRMMRRVIAFDRGRLVRDDAEGVYSHAVIREPAEVLLSETGDLVEIPAREPAP
jgi:cell division transport system ATP-binding protein